MLTSNLGAQELAALSEGAASEEARPAVMAAVAKAFAPEFVNRLDQIVLFNRLQVSDGPRAWSTDRGAYGAWRLELRVHRERTARAVRPGAGVRRVLGSGALRGAARARRRASLSGFTERLH